MLPVMLLGIRPEDRETVMGEMTRQAGEMKIPLQVVMSSDQVSEISRTLEETAGVSVLLIYIGIQEGKIDGRPIELGRRALRMNRDNYIVYLLQSPAMLEKASILCSRHFGMMVCPPKEALVRAACKRILNDYAELIGPEQAQEQAEDDWLVVQNGSAYQRIPVSKIEYVEALNKKLNIYLDDTVMTVYQTLAELEALLGEKFYRAHRSYLVNVGKIRGANLTNLEFEMASGCRVPIARSKRQESKELLQRMGGKAE